MGDLERAFLEHLGDQFTPYIGREEGMPKPPQLVAMEREERRRRQEARRIEEEQRRQQRMEEERRILEGMARQGEVQTRFEAIARAVCVVYNVTWEDILSPSRAKAVFEARAHVCYLATTELGMGPSQVGRILSRDHATIINARDQFARKFLDDPRLEEVRSLLAPST